VLTFLRDKSRAPAPILVGALNTYDAGNTLNRYYLGSYRA